MYSLVEKSCAQNHYNGFNEIKHFVAFFQLWKKPNIKSQNIVSLVLHLKNEIDLEKMLNDYIYTNLKGIIVRLKTNLFEV